jgi:hypothetical protein
VQVLGDIATLLEEAGNAVGATCLSTDVKAGWMGIVLQPKTTSLLEEACKGAPEPLLEFVVRAAAAHSPKSYALCTSEQLLNLLV